MRVAEKLLLAAAGSLIIGALATAAEFDVALVKQFERSLTPVAGNRITMRGTLRAFIAAAYDIKDYQISTTPSWAGVLVYDVIAKAPGEVAPTQDEVRPMFQSLLADRFHLKIHQETRVLPVYT